MVTEAEVRKPVELGFQFTIRLSRLGRNFLGRCDACGTYRSVPGAFQEAVLAAFVQEVERHHPEKVRTEPLRFVEPAETYGGPVAQQYTETTVEGRHIRITLWLDALMTDEEKQRLRSALIELEELDDGVAITDPKLLNIVASPLGRAIGAVIEEWAQRPHPREL